MTTSDDQREAVRVEAEQINGGWPIYPEAHDYIWNAALSSRPALPAGDEEVKSPAEWCKEFGIKIADPDGWDRSNLLESWANPITKAEFAKRAAESTASGDFTALRAALASRPSSPQAGDERDPREYQHVKCDCVPDLGPSHCHFCSEDGAPIQWPCPESRADERGKLIAKGLSAIDRGALGLVTDPEWGDLVAEFVAALESDGQAA